jgi:hypothetical protein
MNGAGEGGKAGRSRPGNRNYRLHRVTEFMEGPGCGEGGGLRGVNEGMTVRGEGDTKEARGEVVGKSVEGNGFGHD